MASLVLLPLFLACVPSREIPPEPVLEPVGQAEYERLLSEYSGMDLGALELVELAQGERKWVEGRLAQAAEALEPGKTWQEVFARLREDHPRTVEELLETYQDEVERAESFVRGRNLIPIPDEPLRVVEARHPVLKRSFPLAVYLNGKLAVVASRGEEDDPSYLAQHCRVCIPPLAVHEGVPGHHAGMQWLSPGERKGIAGEGWFFLEGWAQYAEILMLEERFYQRPELVLGAWQLVLLRTLRAELDALLHLGRITQAEAVERYVSEAYFKVDAAETEVNRHLGSPTMKAAYLVGLLQILELRRLATETSPADFHSRLVQERGAYTRIARDRFGVELEGLCSLERCYAEPGEPRAVP